MPVLGGCREIYEATPMKRSMYAASETGEGHVMNGDANLTANLTTRWILDELMPRTSGTGTFNYCKF